MHLINSLMYSNC